MGSEPYRADPDVVLGVDLGTRLGWSVLSDVGASARGVHLSSGTLDLSPRKGDTTGRRYYLARQHLRRLIHQHRPCHVGYELVRFHGSRGRSADGSARQLDGTAAAHVYGGLRAVLTELCYGLAIPVMEHEVGHLKQFATGKGNAAKPAMIAAAAAAWPDVELIDDNHADAMWLAERTRFQTSIPF